MIVKGLKTKALKNIPFDKIYIGMSVKHAYNDNGSPILGKVVYIKRHKHYDQVAIEWNQITSLYHHFEMDCIYFDEETINK